MGARRGEIRPFTSIPAFGAWLLAALLPLLFAAEARAGPIERVADPVSEATAPVTEAVETVVPPPVNPATPPVPAPPEVKLPEAPGKVPAAPAASETANHTIEAATGAATKATGTVTSGGAKASGEAGKVAAGAAGTAQQASGTASTSAMTGGAPSSGSATPGTSSSAEGKVRESPPAHPAGRTRGPGVHEGVPVGLHPFIYVWPAIALVTRSTLGGFLERWSQAVLALYRAGGGGTGIVPANHLAQASGDGLQPSPAGSPSPSHFVGNPNPDNSGFPTLLLLLVIPLAGVLFTLAFRYEEGLPLMPRRLTRWRH